MKIIGQALFIALATILSACQTSTVAPQQKLTFIDASKFDQELSSSLSSNQKNIDVTFYNQITPNQIPPRMEKWIAEVESMGGKIIIEPPPNEMVPKDPTILLSLFSGLFTFIKNAIGISESAIQKNSVKDRNAVLQLDRNKQGDIYIQKISFPIRAPS
jgi:hypothetical protein